MLGRNNSRGPAGLAGAHKRYISHWPLPGRLQPGTHLPNNHSPDVQTRLVSSTSQRYRFSRQPGQRGGRSIPLAGRESSPGHWPLVPPALCHNPHNFYVVLMDCLAISPTSDRNVMISIKASSHLDGSQVVTSVRKQG